MSQHILASGGYPEFTWPATITETTGKDISTAPVSISLGTVNAPGTWVSGTLTRPTTSSVTIKLLVDNTTLPGTYFVWVKVVDTPEVPARKFHRVVVT